MRIYPLSIITLAMIGGTLAGCRSVGPDSVSEDRYNYSNAIAESWKRQALLNIVKLRYYDLPTYVTVGQVVAGYQMEYSAGIGSELHWRSAVDTFVGPQVGAHYTDRPTITYTPMTGAKFHAALLTPISPEAIFAAIQSGITADMMLGLCINSVNGLQNENIFTGHYQSASPEFTRFLELMHHLQRSGIICFRMEHTEDNKKVPTLDIWEEGISADTASQIKEFRKILRLNPDIHKYRITYGTVVSNDTDIVIHTRSILSVCNTMALHVDLPDQDISSGKAAHGIPPEIPNKIHFISGPDKPENAFVAIKYRDAWFWIEDTDLHTKQAFSFLMLLFTMANTSGEDNAPVLTISTN
jgi:hypothetical protein